MLSDLWRAMLDFVEFLWPLHIVRQWERGVVYVCGRYYRTVGPGCWPKIPWFVEFHDVPIAWALVGMGRSDITLKDGRALSFAAMATVRVVDPAKAINDVDDYTESMQELLASMLAEKLAEIEPERLLPERRSRLVASLNSWLALEAAEFGIEVRRVRFTSFVLNARTYRLLTDMTTVAQW